VSWQHVKAILWLRWRLTVNQWKRGGQLNAAIAAVFVWLFLVLAVGAFFAALGFGVLLLPQASPDNLLLLWDVMVVAFLFMWLTGLITELQKSEALSIEKLLHLPVAPGITYLLNYLSSFLSFSLAIFVAAATGVALSLLFVQGPSLLVTFPLLATFVLMVTAVTHQFRTWLFALMVNKRRRRTILVIATSVFILLVQVPNLINLTVRRSDRDDGRQEYLDQVKELEAKQAKGLIDAETMAEQLAIHAEQWQEKKREDKQDRYKSIMSVAVWSSKILPIGWLPYGVREAARGHLLPALGGILGAFAIGVFSLYRSYRNELRLYRGEWDFEKRKSATTNESDQQRKRTLLERDLPGCPEPVAAVGLANLRALLRAPETKLLVLTPVIILGVLGIGFFRRVSHVPDAFLPLMMIGMLVMTLMCFVQLQCNLFGFDRDAFRVYVLMPGSRHFVLAGKNLAIAPLALGMCLLTLVVIQAIRPLELAHLIASGVQAVSAYLLLSLIGNQVSIIACSPLSAGSFRPKQVRLVTILVHFLVVFLTPLIALPAVVACGSELLIREFISKIPVPWYLMISIVELVGMVWFYRTVLPAQGRLLQRRELKILEVVTSPAE
jgi:ABC-2 type transport system permease protein